MKIRDILIAAGLYLVVLSWMLYYNLSHQITGDGIHEFMTYVFNIANGWHYREGNIVNSCLMTTWVPAMLQKITGWDAVTLFRVFPPVFYALMPMFTYLIARRYLKPGESVIAALVVCFTSSIAYFTDIGRVGVALGFLSGMVWALLNKRLWWGIVFASLVVFSHYGTSLIAVFIAGVICVVNYIINRRLSGYPS